MKNQCVDCIYFQSHRNSGISGECHYGPPTANLNPHGWSMHPRTKGDSWCGEWKPRAREDLIDSNLVDTAHEMLAGNLSVKDFSDSLGDLIVAISHIDQFMKRHPKVEITFSRGLSTDDKVFLRAKVITRSQQVHMYLCDTTALSFEELLLRLSNGIAHMQKDQNSVYNKG